MSVTMFCTWNDKRKEKKKIRGDLMALIRPSNHQLGKLIPKEKKCHIPTPGDNVSGNKIPQTVYAGSEFKKCISVILKKKLSVDTISKKMCSSEYVD